MRAADAGGARRRSRRLCGAGARGRGAHGPSPTRPPEGVSGIGQTVARRLADERLLVTRPRLPSGDELVEVAHEALLRHGQARRLDGQRRESLVLRQLEADARTWLEKKETQATSGRTNGCGSRGGAQADRRGRLSSDQQEFLGRSIRTRCWRSWRPETMHRRRLLIGERLAVLGDPRDGVGVDEHGTPDLDWCDGPRRRGDDLDPVHPNPIGRRRHPRQRVDGSASPAFRLRLASIVHSSRRKVDGANGIGGRMIFTATRPPTLTNSGASATIRRSTSAGSRRWPSAAG